MVTLGQVNASIREYFDQDDVARVSDDGPYNGEMPLKLGSK